MYQGPSLNQQQDTQLLIPNYIAHYYKIQCMYLPLNNQLGNITYCTLKSTCYSFISLVAFAVKLAHIIYCVIMYTGITHFVYQYSNLVHCRTITIPVAKASRDKCQSCLSKMGQNWKIHNNPTKSQNGPQFIFKILSKWKYGCH